MDYNVEVNPLDPTYAPKMLEKMLRQVTRAEDRSDLLVLISTKDLKLLIAMSSLWLDQSKPPSNTETTSSPRSKKRGGSRNAR